MAVAALLIVLALISLVLSWLVSRCPHTETHHEWRGGVWRLRCRDCGRVSHGIQIGRRAA